MGNMIEMTLEQAEKLVEKDKNIEWDGWNLVFYNPNVTSAHLNKKGAFRNGQWVLKNTVAVSGKGTYLVSNKYAKLLTKTRD